MSIKIIGKKITESELREIAKDFYGDMVKGVVDIERGIIAMGGEYHMDANVMLIENGSKQQNIWGFNWYFDKKESVITKNAKYFDVIFIGGEKKYEKAVQVLAKQYLRKVFILTLGKDGSIAYHEGIKILQPAYKIKKVVDTTGCGDAFQAAFLASWLENKNIKTALIKGAKRAADIIKTVEKPVFSYMFLNKKEEKVATLYVIRGDEN